MSVFASRRDFLIRTMATGVAMVSGLTDSHAAKRDRVEHHIKIHKFKFEPGTLTVIPGDTITWTNLDIAPHTATAQDKGWHTGSIRKGNSKSVMVTRDMTRDYYCEFHPEMIGSLIVLHE
ncbi:MAG: hypothetical protein COB90_09045 [Hyphomicrobiales bacterium]|nr:MAG: hypothetical protein COB90_09045 [Hyphomicrobiales bacterium]